MCRNFLSIEMNKPIILLITIFSQFSICNAQDSNISRLNLPVTNSPEHSYIQIDQTNQDLMLFSHDSTQIYLTRSTDDGNTWQLDTILTSSDPFKPFEDVHPLLSSSGNIILTYKSNRHYSIYSDDNGYSWSEELELPTESGLIKPTRINTSCLSEVNDEIWLIYTLRETLMRIKSSDGINWSQDRDTLQSIINNASEFNIIQVSADSLLFFYQTTGDNGNSELYNLLSEDGGMTWSDSDSLNVNTQNSNDIRFLVDNGIIYMFYQSSSSTPFKGVTQSDIMYSTSDDNGITWNPPQTYTRYVGYDGNYFTGAIDGEAAIVFLSLRDHTLLKDPKQYSFWYGTVESADDEFLTPVTYGHSINYRNNDPLMNIKITCRADDESGILSVWFNAEDENGSDLSIELYDDGEHSDELSGDKIFGNEILNIPIGLSYSYQLEITDLDSNTVKTDTIEVSSPLQSSSNVFAFDNNNLWLPIDNRGTLASLAAAGPNGGISSQMRYAESSILYAGGFALSGSPDGRLWSNGNMESWEIKDYQAGNVGSDPGDDLNKVYVLRSSHAPFTLSWLDWKDAVDLGADFYDGDGNGIYDPVDHNGNGLWDDNEDRPDLLGDITAWCVYNDGVAWDKRLFSNVSPQGIEIKQTVFSYNKEEYPELADVIFLKYNIENKGLVSESLNYVYFSSWMDGDLGYYIDDLTGTDTLLNSMYLYNDGPDDRYGGNPPALFVTQLQGPPAYVAGETFEDINNNGSYDEDVDTPLDSVKLFNGPYLGTDYIPGAKNIGITSSIHTMRHNETQGPPLDEVELRGYMMGRNRFWEYIDPCTWEYSEVFGEDCNSVNPVFMNSGDPVKQKGWINTVPEEQRQMMSTGPFTLEKGKPVELIYAYVVGRGSDAISSITAAREKVNDAIRFYDTNFSDYTVGINNYSQNELPDNFRLFQNYPNPFNPSTTIEYSIPNAVNSQKSIVNLTVYDILGREVATLVDKPQPPGNYKVRFNAGNLASGVYFYRLEVNDFMASRKMLLLK